MTGRGDEGEQVVDEHVVFVDRMSPKIDGWIAEANALADQVLTGAGADYGLEHIIASCVERFAAVQGDRATLQLLIDLAVQIEEARRERERSVEH